MHTLTNQEHELLANGNDHANRFTQEEKKVSGWVMRLQRRIELRATGRKMLYTTHEAEEHAAKSAAYGLGPISGDALALARHNGHCWLREQ